MKMFRDIIKNGGGTLNKDGVVSFNKGYIIGQHNLEETQLLSNKDTIKLMESWYTIYKTKYNGLLGFWIDNNKLYIDLVEHMSDKVEAMVLGRMNKELAIWDCKNNKEITL